MNYLLQAAARAAADAQQAAEAAQDPPAPESEEMQGLVIDLTEVSLVLDTMKGPRLAAALTRAATLLQQQATELAALRGVPTTVEQQPWKKPGWCDSEGQCWWFNDESCAWVRVFANKGEYPVHSRMLPHNAISLPEQFNREF